MHPERVALSLWTTKQGDADCFLRPSLLQTPAFALELPLSPTHCTQPLSFSAYSLNPYKTISKQERIFFSESKCEGKCPDKKRIATSLL